MSWWKVPDSADDVTGDGSVDAVDAALLGLAEARTRDGRALPSLPELLAALTGALAAQRELVNGLPEQPRVTTRDGIEEAVAVPADLADAVARAVAGIAEEFRNDRGRRPRPAEVLYTFTFALGGEPDSVLRGPFAQKIVLVLR